MKASQLDPNKVWYSASNEDTRSECLALVPQGKSLLCITASGSRTFDLLMEDPKHIVSIDQNPAQTALALLLTASYRSLDYEGFCKFLGLLPSQHRLEQLENLLPQLPPEAAAFWHRNKVSVDTGLLYCGKWRAILGKYSGWQVRAVAPSQTGCCILQHWPHKRIFGTMNGTTKVGIYFCVFSLNAGYGSMSFANPECSLSRKILI